jgi:hypothetical protein
MAHGANGIKRDEVGGEGMTAAIASSETILVVGSGISGMTAALKRRVWPARGAPRAQPDAGAARRCCIGIFRSLPSDLRPEINLQRLKATVMCAC